MATRNRKQLAISISFLLAVVAVVVGQDKGVDDVAKPEAAVVLLERQLTQAQAAIQRLQAEVKGLKAQRSGAATRAKKEFVRVRIDVTPLTQGDTAGCGPVSLLNMLKLGPEIYRKAYSDICGKDDSQALKRLAEKYTSPKSGEKDKVRFSTTSGINDPNLSKLCQRVARDYKLGPIHTMYTTRKEQEPNANYAKRVNTALVHSLSEGIPVLMSMDSYGVRNQKWVKLTGHYMLITGVQRTGTTNRDNFLIEYIDPVGGHHRQAFVYGSTFRTSRAIAHFKEGDKWLEKNPYLYIAAPDKNMRESRQPWNSRHEYFLTILFGKLKPKGQLGVSP